jgi:serralysin
MSSDRTRFLKVRFAGTVVWVTLCVAPAVAFTPADRWLMTASGSTNLRGTSATLTWSLVPDGTQVASRQPSSLISLLDDNFSIVNRGGSLVDRPWFPLIESCFIRWGELGGIDFVYEPQDDRAIHSQSPGALGQRGDIRLAATQDGGVGGTLAFSQFPDGGDIGFDTADLPTLLNPAGNYRRFRNVLMHEIGHAIGLNHVASGDAAFLMEPAVDTSFDGPQLDDVRGLQHLYGDRFENENDGAGNNSMSMGTDLGALRIGDAVSLGSDAGPDLVIEPADRDFLSITSALNPDFFTFEIAAPALVDVIVTPLGGRFHQEVSSRNELLTDAFAGSDLRLFVLSADGATRAAVNSQAEGGVEMSRNLFLPAAGKYFVEVFGSREVVQLYQLDLTLHSSAVPEPSTAILAAVIAVTICAASLLRRCA